MAIDVEVVCKDASSPSAGRDSLLDNTFPLSGEGVVPTAVGGGGPGMDNVSVSVSVSARSFGGDCT